MDKAEIRLGANYISNYIRPLVEAGKVNIDDYNPALFARMIRLLYEKKIDSRKMRKWIEERIGEKDLEKSLGMSSELALYMDTLEVEALEEKFKSVV